MSVIVMGTGGVIGGASASFLDLPDELLALVLCYLDIPELLVVSRLSHHLRALALDPLLHRLRLQSATHTVRQRLAQRPALHTLQPPTAAIYLTRTHIAARRLHWSLVRIRLNRSLARRPKLATLLAANILPPECCRFDRRAGELTWGTGVAGALIERKRRIEREQIKEGLRVWLERKAREIRARRPRDGGVGVLVWRFSRRMKLVDLPRVPSETPKQEKVSRLKRFWEGLGA